ncbi:7628_t:CDS:2 [Paraglomus brasilianum]|uniref:Proteasome subunit beta n=1 Tax=Paraglomus brasilianum TaxID=144538 RepID=A0A9N9B0I7_9GLOM|nr:7628_t:CDS:2 [Paraglomus brasilianum]
MECIFGFTGKDFVMTATDSTVAQSILIVKSTEDKSRALSKRILLLFAGESGDTVQFAEFIQRNVRLYEIRNGVELSTKSAATFTRRELADNLRSRKQYSVNLILAGYDLTTELPSLYQLDYLGSSVSAPFAAHGYAAHFLFSIFDRYHRPDLSLEEAKALMKMCVGELQRRFLVNLSHFTVKVVDKDGIREIAI